MEKKSFQPVIQNKHSLKAALKPVRQTLAWCGQREVFKRRYVFITREEKTGKSKGQSGGFCLFDSGAEE